MHPLSNGREISSFFCKFAPICKAPLYARMFGNPLYQHKKAFTLLIKNIFSMVLYSVCISVHPLSNGRDMSSYFCKFAPICKAPLYAGMFGNLLYQHKKAFTLRIKNIFSMVLYSFCVFQCIRFQTGGILSRSSVNSPLYVRRPYMQ